MKKEIRFEIKRESAFGKPQSLLCGFILRGNRGVIEFSFKIADFENETEKLRHCELKGIHLRAHIPDEGNMINDYCRWVGSGCKKRDLGDVDKLLKALTFYGSDEVWRQLEVHYWEAFEKK